MRMSVRASAFILCLLMLLTLCTSYAFAEEEQVNIAAIAAASVSSENNEHAAYKAIDNDTGTYWESQSGSDEYITLTWEKSMEISSLYVLWGGGSASEGGYDVKISSDGTTFSNADVTITRDKQSDTQKYDTVVFTNAPITAKAIQLYINRCDKDAVQLWELEVYQQGDESILHPDIMQFTNGTDRFVATTVGEDAVGKRLIARFAVTRDGKTATGTVEITDAYKKVILGKNNIVAGDFEKQNGDYVAGLLIKNVKEDDKVSVEFKVYGETYIFLGSSVTYGASAGGRSFVELIDEKYDVDCIKLAVSGTTLCDINGSSYVSRLVANADKYPVCDHLIVQLSTNDASGGLPLGTLGDSFDINDFDKQTVIGAIEYIIAFAKEKWDCPVSFYTGTKYNSANYAAMVDALLQIKEKWGIGVLDMYNDAGMNAVSAEDYARYMADPIHPNATGYEEWWLPEFEEYLFGN